MQGTLRSVSILLLSLLAVAVIAVPAKRDRHILVLSDGSCVEATAMGDELTHYFLTDDGRCLQCDSTGTAHYVDAEQMFARWEARAAKRQAARAFRHSARKARRQSSMSGITGSKRGLVILVQFQGEQFYYGQDVFNDFFNQVGYSDAINSGSVHDYYLDVSYGQFDFSFDVVGPVQLSKPLSYYGTNNVNGEDVHPAVMAAEAVLLADDDVDFSQYDWDGDGEVEQVFFIHSGRDEAQSGVNKDIWSHAWTLSEATEEGDGDGPVTVDGVVVDSYATCSELRGKNSTGLVGIGTACHEFAHCFGLPDTYDTQGRNFGMNSWDLMDMGEYNGNGGTPAGFTSYERMFCGWLRPTELTEAVRVTDMPSLTSEQAAYIIRNNGKEDEYFLLENRQQEGWDSYVGGHGLIVLHVDYDSLAWTNNVVNVTASHQRMTIVPADGMLSSFSLDGDPYPGTSGNTALGDETKPAWRLFNENLKGEKLMNHSITDISESSDGLISFIFDQGSLAIANPAGWRKADGERTYNLGGQAVSPSYRGITVVTGGDGPARLTISPR